LANRKSFVSSFEERAAGRDADKLVTMALIDVDKFKHINDGYGHAAGDHALAGVAAQIATLAGPDGLAGRWGGDEFIAVVDATGEEARERIESMIDHVSSLVFEEGFDVSVSVGATTAACSIGIERMVEQADDALYQTKEGGRGFLTEYVPGVTPHMAGEKAARAQGDVAREEAPSRSSAVVQSPNVPVRQKLVDLVVGSFMEAVNKMIPFVAGGGILIAIAFLIDGASVDINALSAEARVNFGSITPIAAGLKDVGSAAFNFMLPIFAAFLARSLSGDEAFMAGFAGGYLSSQGSAGFAGAICAAFVAAIVVRMMCGLVGDTSKGVQHVAPVLLYPVFSLLIMYLLMSVVIDPLASGFDAVLTSVLTSLEGGNRVVLGTACGAMMATDMGGPINKAAYHFGTAAIASGKPEIMASVMVGGMVPPCGLALCMLLFRKKFSVSERDRGPATMVMGLSFITEGAIPFLLTDPFRVIPSCMLGSGVAGALSMAFGCTLMAPHGGIFVFPVVGNAGMYLLALGLGSIATAVVLGLLKHAEAGE
jgi:fructose-specific phosphotransferase system IIC component